MTRPIATAIFAAVVTGLFRAVLSAWVGLYFGLLVVAAFGGWIIGTALQTAGPRRRALAAVLGVFAWLVGSVLDFVFSQVILPNATTPLAERLAPGAYLAYASATFDLVQVGAIAILVVVAWRSAR
jgi:hypothetical protein